MKKLLLFLSMACSMATVANATRHTVLVSDFAFTSATVTARVGDTVMWVWTNGDHTTTSTSIPAGAASWDAPITSTATTFSYKLTHTGTYSYVCTPHAPGMGGTINVQSAASVPAAAPVALFRIAPNPAAGSLHIELSAAQGQTNISIIDALGRVIGSGNYSNGKAIDISTADLADGIYIIRATAAGQSYMQTVEIRH